MRLLLVPFLFVAATADPGLLKVPKVYNALITTDQNLSPSRAFPVLQPVVHKTAVGYVPPFYYTQIAPQNAPELVQISQGIAQPSVEGIEANIKDQNSDIPEIKDASEVKQTKKENQVPLSFYPNYHSLYYDPYFYTYNGYDSHLAPSTYQENVHNQASVDPLPPQNFYSEHLLPSLHDEKTVGKEQERKEKIPDVPPPPLPTGISKSS